MPSSFFFPEATSSDVTERTNYLRRMAEAYEALVDAGITGGSGQAATQPEVDAGANVAKYVNPLTLSAWSQNPVTLGAAGVAASLGTDDLVRRAVTEAGLRAAAEKWGAGGDYVNVANYGAVADGRVATSTISTTRGSATATLNTAQVGLAVGQAIVIYPTQAGTSFTATATTVSGTAVTLAAPSPVTGAGLRIAYGIGIATSTISLTANSTTATVSTTSATSTITTNGTTTATLNTAQAGLAAGHKIFIAAINYFGTITAITGGTTLTLSAAAPATSGSSFVYNTDAIAVDHYLYVPSLNFSARVLSVNATTLTLTSAPATPAVNQTFLFNTDRPYGTATISVTAGSTAATLSAAEPAFTSGQSLYIYDSTASNGFAGTVTAVSGTEVTLSAPAGQTASNLTFAFGTNDRAAWLSALSALTTSGRRRLYVPRGTGMHVIGGTEIVLDIPDLEVFGDGYDSKILNATASSFVFNLTTTGIKLRGFELDAGFSGQGIRGTAAHGALLEYLRIKNHRVNGILLVNTNAAINRHHVFLSMGVDPATYDAGTRIKHTQTGYDIFHQGSASENLIYDCDSESRVGVCYGFQTIAGIGATVRNNRIERCNARRASGFSAMFYAHDPEVGNPHVIDNNRITRCRFEATTGLMVHTIEGATYGQGIYNKQFVGSVIHDNDIERSCEFLTEKQNTWGDIGSIENCNAVISNNRCRGSYRIGIHCGDPNDRVTSGNSRVLLSNNIVEDPVEQGIFIQDLWRAIIQGGSISGCGSHGVYQLYQAPKNGRITINGTEVYACLNGLYLLGVFCDVSNVSSYGHEQVGGFFGPSAVNSRLRSSRFDDNGVRGLQWDDGAIFLEFSNVTARGNPPGSDFVGLITRLPPNTNAQAVALTASAAIGASRLVKQASATTIAATVGNADARLIVGATSSAGTITTGNRAVVHPGPIVTVITTTAGTVFGDLMALDTAGQVKRAVTGETVIGVAMGDQATAGQPVRMRLDYLGVL